MTVREGSLEAPTRHPLDWKSPDFYDEAKLEKELERVFDICHGCRRCVNLCTAFPTLFDLVDESTTLEVDGVKKADFGKVVDQCYLCDMCYMTKCPYVPPHPWNVDFPHLMLRAKAVKFRKGEVQFPRQAALQHRRHGQARDHPGRGAIRQRREQVRPCARHSWTDVLGVHKDRVLPEYDEREVPRQRPADASLSRRATAETRRARSPIFSTCYVNYNEPGIGHDLLKVLEHNEVPAIVVEKEACCGMPKLELGDLEAVARNKDINMPVLAQTGARGLRDPHCGAVLHADVQAGTAADVPGRRRRQGGGGSDVRPLRVSGAAPQGRSAQDRFQEAAGQGVLPHAVPPAGAEHGAEDARTAAR